jgi:hypothetical protein
MWPWRCRSHSNRYAFCYRNKRHSTESQILNQYRILYQATNPALFPGKLNGVEALCRTLVVSSSLHQAFQRMNEPLEAAFNQLGQSLL